VPPPRTARLSVDVVEFLLSVVVGGREPGGRVCFYSVRDTADAPLVRRLCALFNRKYSVSTLTNVPPPQFEYAAACEFTEDDAFLLRDEAERLREVTPKGRARLGDVDHLHNLLMLGKPARLQVASFCFYQAAVWETKLRQEMVRRVNGAKSHAKAPSPGGPPSPKGGPAKKKRAGRAVGIEAVKRELIEHIRSARDNAQEAIDRDMKPALLPRPRKQELARRAGVLPYTVTRCFQDSPELQRLWTLAADLDAILKYTK
jgi:hypothetical protein